MDRKQSSNAVSGNDRRFTGGSLSAGCASSSVDLWNVYDRGAAFGLRHEKPRSINGRGHEISKQSGRKPADKVPA
jgi:hypothetical protein